MKKITLFLVGALLSAVAGAQAIYLNDSGTIRKPLQIYVNDAGTIRKIQQIYVNDAGTIRKVWTGQITFSITTGTVGVARGFQRGSMGSIASEVGYPSGNDTFILFQETSGSTCQYQVEGFGSDPGATWFNSLVVNSITKTAASASYAYSAGIAKWTWASCTFSFLNATVYPATVSR